MRSVMSLPTINWLSCFRQRLINNEFDTPTMARTMLKNVGTGWLFKPYKIRPVQNIRFANSGLGYERSKLAGVSFIPYSAYSIP